MPCDNGEPSSGGSTFRKINSEGTDFEKSGCEVAISLLVYDGSSRVLLSYEFSCETKSIYFGVCLFFWRGNV